MLFRSEIVEIANGVIGGKTRSAEIPRIDCLLRSQVQERTRSISEGAVVADIPEDKPQNPAGGVPGAGAPMGM